MPYYFQAYTCKATWSCHFLFYDLITKPRGIQGGNQVFEEMGYTRSKGSHELSGLQEQRPPSLKQVNSQQNV